MKTKKRLKTSLTIILLLLISGLNAQNLDKEKDAFPPDFGKEKNHIVFVTIPGDFQINKAVKNAFTKYYTGSFEIIEFRKNEGRKHNVEGTKYYGFKVIYDKQAGHFSGGGRVGPDTNYSFGINDLASDKLYKLSFFAGTYKKLLMAYVKKLEEIRKSNENSN
jgi:hypothetical protein